MVPLRITEQESEFVDLSCRPTVPAPGHPQDVDVKGAVNLDQILDQFLLELGVSLFAVGPRGDLSKVQ